MLPYWVVWIISSTMKPLEDLCKNKERNFVSRQNYELRKRPRKSREIRDPYKESCTELWTSSSASSSSSSSIGLGTAFFFFFCGKTMVRFRWVVSYMGYGLGDPSFMDGLLSIWMLDWFSMHPWGLEFDEVHSTLLNKNLISSCLTC